jgi:hypothetical protein
MTSQGTTHDRFQRAIQRRNLFRAELALREMRDPSLLTALDYVGLLVPVAAASAMPFGVRDACGAGPAWEAVDLRNATGDARD